MDKNDIIRPGGQHDAGTGHCHNCDEIISTGRVETGKAWIEEAGGALNILLRLVESDNIRGRLDNE